MPSRIAATALLAPMPGKATPPKAALFARAFRALAPFPTQTVRKPPAAAIPATIQESTTDDIGCLSGHRAGVDRLGLSLSHRDTVANGGDGRAFHDRLPATGRTTPVERQRGRRHDAVARCIGMLHGHSLWSWNAGGTKIAVDHFKPKLWMLIAAKISCCITVAGDRIRMT